MVQTSALRGYLMGEKVDIKDEPFKDLVVIINGVPASLEVLGGIKYGEREFIVVTNLPILEISNTEYEIFELIREDGKVSIQSIEDISAYETLVEMWQAKVMEDEEHEA